MISQTANIPNTAVETLGIIPMTTTPLGAKDPKKHWKRKSCNCGKTKLIYGIVNLTNTSNLFVMEIPT